MYQCPFRLEIIYSYCLVALQMNLAMSELVTTFSSTDPVPVKT